MYFLQFFGKKIWNSEKNTFHFSRFYSEIVLNKYGFSYFSYIIQHILNVGKIRNGPTVASFHLLKRLILFDLKSDSSLWCFHMYKFLRMTVHWDLFLNREFHDHYFPKSHGTGQYWWFEDMKIITKKRLGCFLISMCTLCTFCTQ